MGGHVKEGRDQEQFPVGLQSSPSWLMSKLDQTFWGNSMQPQLQLGDSQRVVSVAAPTVLEHDQ